MRLPCLNVSLVIPTTNPSQTPTPTNPHKPLSKTLSKRALPRELTAMAASPCRETQQRRWGVRHRLKAHGSQSNGCGDGGMEVGWMDGWMRDLKKEIPNGWMTDRSRRNPTQASPNANPINNNNRQLLAPHYLQTSRREPLHLCY